MGDRKREIEIRKDEARLREAEAKSKQMGKKIEDIQKSRISPAILSIQDRIKMNCRAFLNIARTISDIPEYDDTIGINHINNLVQSQLGTYKSIRTDICETLKKKEKTIKEKFDKLFPEISHSRDTRADIIDLCCVSTEQLLDIDIFLNRYLSLK